MKVEQKFARMDHGVQFVIVDGVQMMQECYAGNWDIIMMVSDGLAFIA